MLQSLFFCSRSAMRRAHVSLKPTTKHVGCPSIFSNTMLCRKLSYLEEGRQMDPSSDGKKPERPGLMERLKLGWRKYGLLGVATYCILYLSTLSQIYLALHHDVFNAASVGMDSATVILKMSNTLESVTGMDDISLTIQEHPQLGTLLLAYVVNQFTEPFRVAALVYLLPRIAHYLGK